MRHFPPSGCVTADDGRGGRGEGDDDKLCARPYDEVSAERVSSRLFFCRARARAALDDKHGDVKLRGFPAGETKRAGTVVFRGNYEEGWSGRGGGYGR